MHRPKYHAIDINTCQMFACVRRDKPPVPRLLCVPRVARKILPRKYLYYRTMTRLIYVLRSAVIYSYELNDVYEIKCETMFFLKRGLTPLRRSRFYPSLSCSCYCTSKCSFKALFSHSYAGPLFTIVHFPPPFLPIPRPLAAVDFFFFYLIPLIFLPHFRPTFPFRCFHTLNTLALE